MHLHLNHNWTGSNSRRSPNFSGLFRRPFSVRAPHSGFKWLKSATKQLQICFPFLSNLCIFKVWTFWETHKIWKNLPYGFDKSADLLSKRQNHKADFFKLCVLFKKSELYVIGFPFESGIFLMFVKRSGNIKTKFSNLFTFQKSTKFFLKFDLSCFVQILERILFIFLKICHQYFDW